MSLFQRCERCGVYITGLECNSGSDVNTVRKHENVGDSRDQMTRSSCGGLLQPVQLPNAYLRLTRISSVSSLKTKTESPLEIPHSGLQALDTDTSDSEELESEHEERKKAKTTIKQKAPPSQALAKYKINCDKCPGQFYSKCEYNRHVSVHNGDRNLITCLICQRVFNKRDSLNSHITAHLTAETKETELNLLQCFPETEVNQWARHRQFCKYCLLVHLNHRSYVHHFKTEHRDADTGTRKRFPCIYDKCRQDFETARELVDHAKMKHPSNFYGKLTYTRMTHGFYTGKFVLENKSGKAITTCAKPKKISPRQYPDRAIISKSAKTKKRGKSLKSSKPSDNRKIMLKKSCSESTSILEDEAGCAKVEKEPIPFYSNNMEENLPAISSHSNESQNLHPFKPGVIKREQSETLYYDSSENYSILCEPDIDIKIESF